jgi:hypothetical protein
LGFLLAPTLGLVGAVVANASVQALAVVVTPLVVRHSLGLRFPVRGVLRVLGAGVPLALAVGAVVLTVDSDVVALVLGVLVAIPAYAAGLALTRAVPPPRRPCCARGYAVSPRVAR